MSEGLHTAGDIVSLILILAYITGVLFLIGGAAVRFAGKKKRSKKLSDISLALLAMGGVTLIFALVWNVRLKI